MSKKSKSTLKKTLRAQIIWRYVIVSLGILFFAGLITRSAVKTTITNVEQWNQKANKDLSRVDTIQPRRGDILAADGSILATNVNFYNIRIDFCSSQFMEDKFRAALPELAKTLAANHPSHSETEWREILAREIDRPKAKRKKSFLLLRDLTYDESEKVKSYPFFRESKNNNCTGYVREVKLKRCYPYGDMARRSVGRVCENKQGHIRGLSGLEYALDSMLYGYPGVYKKVPLTKNIVNWTDIPARDGYTLKTTIDIAMQDIVETELNKMLDSTRAAWGTCVLMEVKTGDIKAISNLERDSASGKYIEAQNYALLGFEPGSVMKTISMVIALEDGFVKDINEVYNIGGGYVFGGGSPIRDSHSPAQLPVSRFLEYSSNIGMTKLVAPHFRDNPNRFRERIAQMGFLDRFNTGIAGERPPVFPKLDKDHGWLVSLGRQTYGYASQIPPLYTCAFYNAIANGGRFVRPRIVSAIRTPRGDSILPVSYVRDRICSEANAATVRSMLRQVVTGKGGTARNLQDSLVHIAGKTGTSKVAIEARRDALGKKIEDSSPRGYLEGQYHLTFCGFFPYEDPKYTCIVMISRPAPEYRSAGKISGAVLRNIARKMYSRGMLGNSSDYHAGAKGAGSRPTVYASDGNRAAAVKGMIGQSTVKRIVSPKTTSGGIPDVSGLGLRQAVEVLENAGYKVRAKGSGYVAAQTPAAGTRASGGSTVQLSLRH